MRIFCTLCYDDCFSLSFRFFNKLPDFLQISHRQPIARIRLKNLDQVLRLRPCKFAAGQIVTENHFVLWMAFTKLDNTVPFVPVVRIFGHKCHITAAIDVQMPAYFKRAFVPRGAHNDFTARKPRDFSEFMNHIGIKSQRKFIFRQSKFYRKCLSIGIVCMSRQQSPVNIKQNIKHTLFYHCLL